MGDKLRKVEKDYYTLYDSDGDIVASNNPKTPTSKKLSLKNCQVIENGYDLDELALDYYKLVFGNTKSYKDGFQKALQLLGDKKFSEKDMIEFAKWVFLEISSKDITPEEMLLEWKSLQQTEFDVEIEMECCGNYMPPCNNNCEYGPKQKLDADGCLILKRIEKN